MRISPYPLVPEAEEMAEAVAIYWEKIGIKVKPKDTITVRAPFPTA
jgi:hypothetical protein